MSTIPEIEAAIEEGDIETTAKRIAELVRQGRSPEGRHIRYAHLLVASAPWPEVNALVPTGTNSLVETGWLNSLLRGRPVNKAGQPVPWFTYPAIDFLVSILNPRWTVFEWGSGNSTLWWASQCAHVTAIEDNQSWYSEVKGQLPANTTYTLAPDLGSYVGAIESDPGQRFDVIVIDGSHRNDCAARCLPYLTDRGIIIFDNSDCLDYDAGIALLSQAGLYRLDHWGLIPSYLYRNCTSIFLKDPTILQNLPNPTAQSSILGPSCGQAIDTLQGKR